MKRAAWLSIPAALVFVVLAVPTAAAAASGTTHGTATSCYSLSYCVYKLNNSAGSSYAYTYGNYAYFKLPGETNLSRATYTATVVNVSGQISHVVGSIWAVDANSGKVVVGSTNTFINATKHCSHNGCGYTYVVVNGSIALRVTTTDGTSTTITCSPTSFAAGSSTKCTAKVTDLANASKVVVGNVTFSTYYGAGSLGTFQNHGKCALANGTCTVKFTAADETVGSFWIYANFHGYPLLAKSQGMTGVTVH
jgi:hypothetical protein